MIDAFAYDQAFSRNIGWVTTEEQQALRGKRVAIATNVKKEGASLRPLGAKMAVTTTQEIAGSVTGGCIGGGKGALPRSISPASGILGNSFS